MVDKVDVSSLKSMGDSALAGASNLNMLGKDKLSALKDKFAGMSATDFSTSLQKMDVSALKDSVAAWGSGTKVWAQGSVSTLTSRLQGSDAWGAAKGWTEENVSSLGDMLTWVPVVTLKEVAGPVLAAASNLSTLSGSQIAALGTKMGSMSVLDLGKTLTGVDVHALHAAMLSQCNIECADDTSLAFLEDPDVANGVSALAEFGDNAATKAAKAAKNYAETMCQPGSDIGEALQAAKSEASVCTGSSKVDQSAMNVFSTWSVAQQSTLLHKVSASQAFGQLSSWTGDELNSLCNGYAALTPSNIALIAAPVVANYAAQSATGAAAAVVFGPAAGTVVAWGVSKAAARISPEQRQAWANKMKEGFNSVTGWGCETVASARELVAGLTGSELGQLSVGAVKGISAGAIEAMDASQVAGFSAEQLANLVDSARDRISGGLLDGLSEDQTRAAVCGVYGVTAAVAASATKCPASVVDTTVTIPPGGSVPTAEDIVATFDDAPGVTPDMVTVVSIVPPGDRPASASDGSVQNPGTEVTVRVSFPPGGTDGATAVGDIQTQANAVAASAGGAVTESAAVHETGVEEEDNGGLGSLTVALIVAGVAAVVAIAAVAVMSARCRKPSGLQDQAVEEPMPQGDSQTDVQMTAV